MLIPPPLLRLWWGEPCPPVVRNCDVAGMEAKVGTAIGPFCGRTAEEHLRGRVFEGEVVLYWYTPMYRNSCRPVFRGKIVRDEAGSRLEGRFSTFRLTQIFLAFWFGFPAVIGISMLSTVVVPLAMGAFLALGVGMVALSQHMSRREKDQILQSLQRL